MTRNWSSLPPEILLLIFGHVGGSSDILQCQLACKSWASSAKEKLYEKVELSRQSNGNSFLDSLRNSNDNCDNYIKHLILGNWALPDSNTTIAPFFELCPNVQVFTLNDNIMYLYHWKVIVKELNEGKWQRLKAIPPPPHHSGLESYSEVVLDRAAVLDSLTLWLSGKNNAPYFKELIKNLSVFIKVKNIDVRINRSMELPSLELVLGSRYYCSQLEEVTFNVFSSRSFSTFKPSTKTKELSSVRPYPNIKIFKGEHLIFTDHS